MPEKKKAELAVKARAIYLPGVGMGDREFEAIGANATKPELVALIQSMGGDTDTGNLQDCFGARHCCRKNTAISSRSSPDGIYMGDDKEGGTLHATKPSGSGSTSEDSATT